MRKPLSATVHIWLTQGHITHCCLATIWLFIEHQNKHDCNCPGREKVILGQLSSYAQATSKDVLIRYCYVVIPSIHKTKTLQHKYSRL